MTQKISLKNLTSGCFADTYILQINSSKVSKIAGADSLGSIPINVKRAKTSTLLTANLNDEVVGKNKTVTFELHYVLSGLAKRGGLVWDVTIPKLAASEKITSYDLKLVTPTNFGKIFTISPKPKATKYTKENTQVFFESTSITSKGVSASFGDYQEIGFKMAVPLQNRSFLPKTYNLYLPPDTDKQRVNFIEINPRPEKMFLDKEGNYIAQFTVRGGSLQEIKIQGVARVAGAGRKYTPPAGFRDEDFERLREGTKFMQVQDRLVQEKAKKLKSIEKIYDFVVGFLDYNSKALETGFDEREGASKLLQRKETAGSLDFVDLFVSISRAAGFPTREVIGFVLNEGNSTQPVFIGEPLNTSKAHVWAQVYQEEKGIWLTVDPTWGRTSNLNYVREDIADRLVLFVSGSGDFPPDLRNSFENIEIDPAKEAADFSSSLDINLKMDQAFAGFPTQLSILVKNDAGTSFTGAKIKIEAEGVGILGDKEIDIPVIFPYETREYNIRLRGGGLLGNTSGQVIVILEAQAGEEVAHEVETADVIVKPFFSLGTQQLLLLAIIVLLVIGVAAPNLQKILKK